jgi:hypothetical protein
MRVARTIRLGVALAALAASGKALAQAAIVSPGGCVHVVSSKGPDRVATQVAGEVVREIDDPHTGARWLLTRDSLHPGGPGRMVLIGEPRGQAPNVGLGELRIGTQNGLAQGEQRRVQAQPAIRAGDHLIVEQDTAVVEARLEAVALNSAAVGSQFNARLALGGRVVRAVALAPGRAALLAETEARP